MKEYIFRNKPVAFPESIDELTPAQYEYYIFISSMLAGEMLSLQNWRVRWFSYLAGLKRVNYTILHQEYIQQAEANLLQVTDCFLKNEQGKVAPTFATCRNLLTEYNGFKGPADWLNGLKFGKFVQCVTLLDQIKPGTADRYIYEEIARVLYSIPEGTEVPAVLTWHAPVLFHNVCEAIQSGPIEINGREINLSIIFKNSGPSRPDDKTGWAGITFEVAAAGVFGNVHELDDSDFWAVLLYLYKCKFEYNHEKKYNK